MSKRRNHQGKIGCNLGGLHTYARMTGFQSQNWQKHLFNRYMYDSSAYAVAVKHCLLRGMLYVCMRAQSMLSATLTRPWTQN